ncbi:hypothetical protein [Microbulbifer epialgicus]|uniref:SnoaL-like domain-containing protein n=1 Tax=Microbulbifer epialgicus TaxID=393907 RepID=A0ABV4P0N0_9GAMM
MGEFIDNYVSHCQNFDELLGEQSFTLDECYECYTPFSRLQRKFAEESPHIYSQEVILPNGELSSVIRQAEHLNLDGKVIAVFGVFAVTDKGIECLSHDYFISKHRYNEDDWDSHMQSKTWVKIEDFKAALEHGRSLA